MKKVLTLLFAVALGLNLSAQEECMNPDVNCDGYVNVNDLLGLLGYFGSEDLDGDGIWDSQDDCVDDGCGICDGPGPQVLVVDTITFSMDSIFIEAVSIWIVFEVPDTTFTLVCTNPGCTDPSAPNYDPFASEADGSCFDSCSNELTMTFDGYTYDLVVIGDQCWFAENLRTEFYANGDSIPANLSDEEWGSTTIGAGAVYEGSGADCDYWSFDGTVCDPEWALNEYGRLYNWYAVDDARGLCPGGWHVPTDGEWTIIADFLGGDSIAGDAMKTTYGWLYGENGSNSSGFSGLPGGLRDSMGNSYNGGYNGYFWSASKNYENGAYAWMRWLYVNNALINRNNYYQRYGFSVRCVRD
jgi:uncharacterized protein (TIGR02145 family)